MPMGYIMSKETKNNMANILNLKSTVPIKNETKAALGTDESRETIDMIKSFTEKIKTRTIQGGILADGVADAFEELITAIRELEANSKGRRAISLNKKDYQFVESNSLKKPDTESVPVKNTTCMAPFSRVRIR